MEYLKPGENFEITIDNKQYSCFLYIEYLGWSRLGKVSISEKVNRSFLFFKWVGFNHLSTMNLGDAVSCEINELIDGKYYYLPNR